LPRSFFRRRVRSMAEGIICAGQQRSDDNLTEDATERRAAHFLRGARRFRALLKGFRTVSGQVLGCQNVPNDFVPGSPSYTFRSVVANSDFIPFVIVDVDVSDLVARHPSENPGGNRHRGAEFPCCYLSFQLGVSEKFRFYREDSMSPSTTAGGNPRATEHDFGGLLPWPWTT